MAGTTASQGRPAGLARDEKGRAVDVHKFKAAVLGNTKRRSLAEAEPVRGRQSKITRRNTPCRRLLRKTKPLGTHINFCVSPSLFSSQALMQALVAVDNDGGAALQEYLEKEHIECQNGKDGSTLLPEAMRAKARVPR